MKLLNIRHSFMIVIVLLTVVLSLYQPGCLVLAAGTTVASVSTPAQPVSPGQQFTVNIIIQPNKPVAGVQFNLSFNPSLVHVKSINEGNFFNQGGADTYFMPGTINNTTGTINGVAVAIIGNGQTVSAQGILAVINMTANATDGTCLFSLSNVIIGDANGQSLPVNTVNGQVVISGTTTTPPPPPPGGGGGGGGGGFGTPGVYNIFFHVRSDGLFIDDVLATSVDNMCSVFIPKNTTGLAKNGSALWEIRVIRMDPQPTLPTDFKGIGFFYDVGLDGTTFQPAITISFSYKDLQLPAGISENDIVVAWRDADGKWNPVPSTVDTNLKIVSAQISHFTLYGLVISPPAAPTTTTTTTTAPITTTPTTMNTTPTPSQTSIMTITTISTPINTTTLTATSTISAGLPATVEPSTIPNNTRSDNIPTFRLSLLAIAIGIATFLIIVTATIILLRRRNSLKRDGHSN